MKRVVAVLLCILIVAVMPSAAYAADLEIGLDRLGNYISEQNVQDTEVSVLNNSRTVKNKLIVAENEYLVIPSSSRLILKNGIYVLGNVFIENGAQMNVLGGDIQIDGTVICGGKLTVNSKADITVVGDLIVLNDAAFKLGKGAGYFVGSNANIVTHSEDALAAVTRRIDPFSGNVLDCTVITEKNNDISLCKDNLYSVHIAEDLAGAVPQYVSILYSNGACVRAEMTAGKYYSSINEVDIRAAVIAIENTETV